MNLLNYFKALSDKTRLRLINILLNYELNVNEIVSVLEMSQPRISRHLKVLLECGLATYRRDGLWVFYSVSDKEESYSFIDSIKNFLNNDEEFKIDLNRCKTIIENRSKETTSFFDSIAGDWPKLKENIIGNFNITDIISKYINNCKLAVDIGCGTGDLIPLLLNFADNVIGVDRSQKMLDEAKRNLSINANRVSLRLGEVEHLPLSDNEADFALANMVLHHLSSPIEALKEVFRVLKKRGSVIIIDFLKHNNELLRTKYGDRWLGFEEDEMKKWLIKTNFNIKDKAQYQIKSDLKLFLFLAEKQ